jgi:xylan 1,4-beta-xylosidase
VIHNPVLPGFNPDPSILRVGGDYYIATSTFVWEPGIRLFRSTDLVSWRLLGHALTPGTHDLRGVDANCGIWAPNLTHDPVGELFYLTYSLVHSTTADYFDVDNLVITASSIDGPWSEPAYLSSVGFDPSFLHDDDGRHWVVALEWDPRDGYEHPGAIVLEEYDPMARRLVGPVTRIFRGATDRGCLEGPNLYRKDGWYYLVAAEGGTGFGHGVTVSRSREITGPYRPGPVNPFLTSNPAPHYGRNDHDYLRPQLFNPAAPLQKAGHGSWVDTPDGQWYLAHLCARPLEPSRQSILGRETALQRLSWTEDGWPQLADGGVLPQVDVPAPTGGARDVGSVGPEQVHDDFDRPVLDLGFSTLRRPGTEQWLDLTSRPGSLTVRGGHALTSRFDTSLVATQLSDFTARVTTQVDVEPDHFSQSAGLVLYYDNLNFVYLRVYASESLRSRAVGVVLVRAGVKQELLLDRRAIGAGPVILRAEIADGCVQFAAGIDDLDLQPVGRPIDITFLGDEATRGFTGVMIGLASVDAFRRNLLAHFDHFDLRPGR